MSTDPDRAGDERYLEIGPDDSPHVPSDPSGWGWGWWPWASRRSGADEIPAHSTASETGDGSGSGLLEENVLTLLVVVGAVLFVIPDPVTTAVGAALLIVGLVAWLLD